eukprot:scaffold128_cov248-Pinguiococcus_pyrenoidosus.AAC.10
MYFASPLRTPLASPRALPSTYTGHFCPRCSGIPLVEAGSTHRMSYASTGNLAASMASSAASKVLRNGSLAGVS